MLRFQDFTRANQAHRLQVNRFHSGDKTGEIHQHASFETHSWCDSTLHVQRLPSEVKLRTRKKSPTVDITVLWNNSNT